MAGWEDGNFEPEVVASIFKAIGGIGIIAFVLFCAEVLLMVCYALLFCGKTVGKDYETSEIFELAFSARGIRAVIQRVLGEIGSIMAFFVPYFAIIFVVASGAGWFPILMSTIFLMAGMGFYLYLRVRWAFGLTTIAWEDQSIGGAFSRSSHLFSIRENATFWIVALFSVVTAFAVSLAATPLQYFAMYDVSMAYAAALAENPFDPEIGTVADAFANVSMMFAVLITFYITMKSAVKSAYLTTIYFDLRARHGEFATAEFNASESDTSELGPSELG